MTKIKKVKRTNQLTLNQMSNMASNLCHRFNKPALIDIDTWHTITSTDSFINDSYTLYRIYIENVDSYCFRSWKKLQSKYFELMEEESHDLE